MLNTYYFSLQKFSLRKILKFSATKKTSNEFDDGSGIPSSSDKMEAGKSNGKGKPNQQKTGVQENTRVVSKAAGTRRNSMRISHNSVDVRENRQKVHLDRSSGPKTNYTPINLSSTLVSKKLLNRNLLSNPARFSSQENIDIRFTVKPMANILEHQSLTWALKLDVSFELDLYRIFGRERSPGEYVQRLQYIYIYSYYKALLLGMNEYRIDQTSDADHCLVGHALLYQVLYKRSYSIDVFGIYTNYFIEFSNEDSEFVLNEAKKYSFIANSIVEAGSRFNIVNSQIERHIEQLRLAISSTDCDVLFIRLSDASKLLSYTSCSSLPIANSFWSTNQKKWFYSYNEYSQVNGNTLLYGKATFITLKSIDSITLRDFEEVVNSDSQNILIKYEVSCTSSSKYFDCKLEGSKLNPKDRTNQ